MTDMKQKIVPWQALNVLFLTPFVYVVTSYAQLKLEHCVVASNVEITKHIL